MECTCETWGFCVPCRGGDTLTMEPLSPRQRFIRDEIERYLRKAVDGASETWYEQTAHDLWTIFRKLS